MNWEKFIRDGFGSENEKKDAEKYLKTYQPTIITKDDDLHLKWYMKEQMKYFTVVCACGNNRMLYHENGIRCHICGRFHSHENFLRMKNKARKEANNLRSLVEQIPQPLLHKRIYGRPQQIIGK